MRAKYYRDLKHFLVIPERFGGVGDGSIFKVGFVAPRPAMSV